MTTKAKNMTRGAGRGRFDPLKGRTKAREQPRPWADGTLGLPAKRRRDASED